MAKTNKGLVDYAKAQLGLPYWYGTFGLTADAALYASKKKQYPDYYRSWNDFPTQYGKRVHDCVGLIKGYLWSDSSTAKPKYNVNQDVSANGMRNACKEKGDIGTMPDVPGVLVFMQGHVGVYIGDGWVIEARGHEYGVVKTALKGRAWRWWGKCPWIEYTGGTSSSSSCKVKVNVGEWFVRTGAGTEFKAITTVKQNEVYEADRKDNNTGWYHIPALSGWVSWKAVTEIK